MAKNERFERIYSQGTLTATQIWVDKETGVNYLFHKDGYSGGLTVTIEYKRRNDRMKSSRSSVVKPIAGSITYKDDGGCLPMPGYSLRRQFSMTSCFLTGIL